MAWAAALFPTFLFDGVLDLTWADNLPLYLVATVAAAVLLTLSYQKLAATKESELKDKKPDKKYTLGYALSFANGVFLLG